MTIAEKLQIALYDTREEGVERFRSALHNALQRQDKTDVVDICVVDATAIRDGYLHQDNVAGLLMPGRNSGQAYRDELGHAGFAQIQAAATQGLAVTGICAASYVLSAEVCWQNEFEARGVKNVYNDTPLFDGTAIGPFNNVWLNGYCYPIGRTPHADSSILLAQVVDIAFLPDLHDKDEAQAGHAVYWGGGAFVPNQANATIIPLASYSAPVELPGPSAIARQTDALIQFNCGKGKILFSNIHPEVTPAIFAHSFAETPRARALPGVFQNDLQKLQNSSPMHERIFDLFIENSLAGADCPAPKKPVAIAEPSL